MPLNPGADARATAGERVDRVTEADLASLAVWSLGLLPLGRGSPPCPGSALEAALRCADGWAQRYAIEALARIGDDDARGTLARLAAARDAGEAPLTPEAARGPRPGTGHPWDGRLRVPKIITLHSRAQRSIMCLLK